jgi:hypothetical protein
MRLAERILNPRKTYAQVQVASKKIAGRVEYHGVELSEDGRPIGIIRLPGYYPNAESAEEYLRSQGYTILSGEEVHERMIETQLKARQVLAHTKKTIDEAFKEDQDFAPIKGSEEEVALAEKERDKTLSVLKKQAWLDQHHAVKSAVLTKDQLELGLISKEKADRSIEMNQGTADNVLAALEKARALSKTVTNAKLWTYLLRNRANTYRDVYRIVDLLATEKGNKTLTKYMR